MARFEPSCRTQLELYIWEMLQFLLVIFLLNYKGTWNSYHILPDRIPLYLSTLSLLGLWAGTVLGGYLCSARPNTASERQTETETERDREVGWRSKKGKQGKGCEEERGVRWEKRRKGKKKGGERRRKGEERNNRNLKVNALILKTSKLDSYPHLKKKIIKPS